MVNEKIRSQCTYLYIDFGNLRISMSSDPGDPYTYYHQYNGKIIGEDESEEKTEIGDVRLAYFSLFSASFFQISAALSQSPVLTLRAAFFNSSLPLL